MSLIEIGYKDYMSDGGSFLLVYYPATKKIYYVGTHEGQITGPEIVAEGYASMEEIVARVKSLKLILTQEDAETIVQRASAKGLTLPDNILLEIANYIGNEPWLES